MAELTALASPPCHDCGKPVKRVEMTWERFHTVCDSGHRVPVEPTWEPALSAFAWSETFSSMLERSEEDY